MLLTLSAALCTALTQLQTQRQPLPQNLLFDAGCYGNASNSEADIVNHNPRIKAIPATLTGQRGASGSPQSGPTGTPGAAQTRPGSQIVQPPP